MKTEMFKDAAGEWRFRIKADNNEIVAQSESYKNFRDALDIAHKLQPDASVRILGEDDEPDAA